VVKQHLWDGRCIVIRGYDTMSIPPPRISPYRREGFITDQDALVVPEGFSLWWWQVSRVRWDEEITCCICNRLTFL
jgi:hypothetical protein